MKAKTRMGNSLLPGLKYLAEYFEKGLKQKQSKPQDTFILLQKTKQKKNPARYFCLSHSIWEKPVF